MYYRARSGLAHREGNLRPGATACGHWDIRDLEKHTGDPDGLRCWTCYKGMIMC